MVDGKWYGLGCKVVVLAWILAKLRMKTIQIWAVVCGTESQTEANNKRVKLIDHQNSVHKHKRAYNTFRLNAHQHSHRRQQALKYLVL